MAFRARACPVVSVTHGKPCSRPAPRLSATGGANGQLGASPFLRCRHQMSMTRLVACPGGRPLSVSPEGCLLCPAEETGKGTQWPGGRSLRPGAAVPSPHREEAKTQLRPLPLPLCSWQPGPPRRLEVAPQVGSQTERGHQGERGSQVTPHPGTPLPQRVYTQVETGHKPKV